MSVILTLTGSNEIAEPQRRFWGCIDRLKSAKTRTRLSFFFAFNVLIALAVLPFLEAVTDQTVKASVRPNGDLDYWPLAQVQPSIDDQAVYVHSKLMRVATSKSGAPVLRFVECRHYPKEHMKVVQTRISPDGHAVLRFMPGDYCLFGSVLAATVTDAPQGIDADFRQPNQPQFPRTEKPPTQADPLKELLTPFQRYACEKFGPACSIALAIQFAENPQGACEIYHYNSTDGTLDWGFFQINTIHLMRPGLNLRDLLDCKTNIDFAYELYRARGFEPWSTYVSGEYRKFLGHHQVRVNASMAALHGSVPFNVLRFR